MGKGDRRTRRGKLFKGTYGATRKKNDNTKKYVAVAKPLAKPAPEPVVEKKPRKKKEE
jgi:ribosomal small subunit protein bTHX